VLREQFVEQYVAPLRDRLGEVAPDLPRSLIARLAPLRLDLATVHDSRRARIRGGGRRARAAHRDRRDTDEGPRLVYADLFARARRTCSASSSTCSAGSRAGRRERLAAHERRLLSAYGSTWLAPGARGSACNVGGAPAWFRRDRARNGRTSCARATSLRRVAPALREIWADGALVSI